MRKVLVNAVISYAVGVACLWGGSLTNVVFNEIHYDPAPDLSGDANADGIRHFREDEFVEIVNNNPDAVDMSGWVLRVDDADHFLFPPGTVVNGQNAVVVFGGGIPEGTFGGDGTWVFSASQNWRPGLVINEFMADPWTIAGALTSLVTGIDFPQNSATDTVNGTQDEGFYRVEVELK